MTERLDPVKFGILCAAADRKRQLTSGLTPKQIRAAKLRRPMPTKSEVADMREMTRRMARSLSLADIENFGLRPADIEALWLPHPGDDEADIPDDPE